MTRRLALLAAFLVALAACTNASGDDTTTTTAPATTTTASTTTTTVATTTTTASTTTTAVATTTSTVATTTTVQTDELLMSDEGLQAGSTWVPLGTLEDEAIAAVNDELGPPTQDSGWVDSFSVYGTCPGPLVRGVHWRSFVMLFTQAETDFWSAGVPHFFAWYYTDVPPALATTEGLALGDTIATLEALYGGPKLTIAEDPFDSGGAIWQYDTVGWTGLFGYADSQEPTGVITSINGGRGCGE
jgi:hypothetical protein